MRDARSLPTPSRSAAGATRPPSPSARPPSFPTFPGSSARSGRRRRSASRSASAATATTSTPSAPRAWASTASCARSSSGGRPGRRPPPTGATSTTSPTRAGPARCASRRAARRSSREEVRRLVEELRAAIPAVFESEDYRTRKKLVEAQLSQQGEKVFTALEARARERGVAIVKTPAGVGMAPLRDGEVIDPEEFQKLPAREQERMKAEMVAVQQELQEAMETLPREARRQRDELRRLDRLVTASATAHLVDEVRARWADVPAVLEHLAEVEKDVVDNAEDFLPPPEGASAVKALLGGRGENGRPAATRSTSSSTQPRRAGAPVVYEDHPTHANLVGPRRARRGDGQPRHRLHARPGGRAPPRERRLPDRRRAAAAAAAPAPGTSSSAPCARGVIRIESLGQALSLTATASLEPEPIPLEVKVVLLGERHLYYLLSQLDPEFPELFKVAADFEEEIERTRRGRAALRAPPGDLRAARGPAPPRPRGGGARHRAGLAAAGRRSSGCRSTPRRSPTCCARPTTSPARRGRRVVTAEARAGGARRAGAAGEPGARAHPGGHPPGHAPHRHATARSVGQVNGLVVLQLGGYAFGRPSRHHRAGAPRERQRGGHREGGGARRADPLEGRPHPRRASSGSASRSERPLSLAASLVFEQSYSRRRGRQRLVRRSSSRSSRRSAEVPRAPGSRASPAR